MLILQTVWSTQRRIHWNQQEHDAQKIHSCTKFYNKWSRSFGISQSWTKVGYLSEQCGSFPRVLLLACLKHASSNPGIFFNRHIYCAVSLICHGFVFDWFFWKRHLLFLYPAQHLMPTIDKAHTCNLKQNARQPVCLLPKRFLISERMLGP